MSLNIVSGGYAIPLGNNFYLMQGNKHNKGEKRTPTDLTYYNKGGGIKQGKKLEVEGGEIEQKLPGELRVFSAQPMINGKSPASLVMEGANPDMVFSIQQSLNGNHRGDKGKDGALKTLTDIVKNTIKKEYTPSKQQMVDMAWASENPNNKGYNKTKNIYTKYEDPNGKGFDVGPGLFVGKGIKDKSYYTKEELDEASYQYGLTSLSKIADEYNGYYGTEKEPTPFDYVPTEAKLLLLDTRYQNGSLSQKDWPSLYKAVRDKNYGEALRQSRSKFTDGKGIVHRDNDRVRRRADYLYPGQYEVTFEKDSEELPTVTRIKEKLGGIIKTNQNMSKNSLKIADITSGLVHHSTGEQKQFKCGGRKKMAYGDDIIDSLNEEQLNNSMVPGVGQPVIVPTENNKNDRQGWLNSVVSSDPESFWSTIASAGSNALSAGLGWLTNKVTLNRLAKGFRKAPAPIIAPKLKTQYNVEPQLADIRSMIARSEEDINANTASSRVGLARKQRVRNAAVSDINKLYGQKENVETQLINADRTQQYEAAKLNAQRYDDWREKENTFQLGLLDKRGENTMALINSLNRGFQDILGNMRQQRNFRNTLAAQLMTNPDAAKLFTDKDNKSLINYINNLFK